MCSGLPTIADSADASLADSDTSILSINFDVKQEMPIDDQMLWDQHNLAIANGEAYPLAASESHTTPPAMPRRASLCCSANSVSLGMTQPRAVQSSSAAHS